MVRLQIDDLRDREDVATGLAVLTCIAARYQDKSGVCASEESESAPLNEEAKEEATDLLRHEVRGLLQTKTGRVLIAPFARQFPDGASIEEVGGIIPCDPGVDRVRKAHSLMAGLGRWETPRQIAVFESIGGRPQRYRMNPRILEIVKQEIGEQPEHA